MKDSILFLVHIREKSTFSPKSIFKVIACLFAITYSTFFPHNTFGQTSKVDSLKEALSLSTNDIDRISLLSDLSKSLSDSIINESLQYARKALSLSRQIKDKESEANEMFNIGLLLFETSETDSSLLYFEESKQIAENLNLGELQADNLMRIANWYRYHSVDSAKTVSYLLQSAEVSKAANYDYGMARSYAKLASVYTKYDRIPLCEKYLKLSAPYYLKTKYGREDISHYYNEVGNKIWDYNPKKSIEFYFEGLSHWENPLLKVSLGKAFSTIGQESKAIKYLKEAIIQLDAEDEDRNLGLAMAELAIVQFKVGNYKEAHTTCEKVIARITPLSIGIQSALPSVYETMGQLMEREGKDKSALDFFVKSLDKANEINVIFNKADMTYESVQANIVLGNFYSKRAPEKAEEYCKKALENAQKSNYANLEIDAYDCLHKTFKENKMFSKALSFYERREKLQDSLSTQTVGHAIEVAYKDQELAQESYQKELKEAQLENQYKISRIFIISSVIGSLLIGLLLWAMKLMRKQNAEINGKTAELLDANKNLARSNDELERFAYVASHDLKSPLSTIIGFSGLIGDKLTEQDSGGTFKEYIGHINNNARQMRTLIDEILKYSILSSPDTEELQVISLNKLVREISKLTHKNSKGKKLIIEASELPKLKWNYSKILLLFKNFIENGLKYNDSENPTVKIKFTNSQGKNVIHIQDNGIGIKEEDFDKIFVLFRRLHDKEKYEGTGMGLATCKKIIDEFNGEIEISSQVGIGTIFKIELPDTLLVSGLADDTKQKERLQI